MDESRDPEIEEPTAEATLSEVEKQYAAQPASLPRRIHIIGTGSIGKLVAHSLRSIPDPPPITLILHRYKLMEAWEKSRKVITVQDGEYATEQRGFDAELSPGVRRQHGVQYGGSKDIYEVADEAGLRPHAVADAVKAQRDREGSESGTEAGYQPMVAGDAIEQADINPNTSLDAAQLRRNPAAKYWSDEPIRNLIIATKTVFTIPALLAVKHRITRESTICFLQNGMGVIDDVNKEIFPDESTRPNYVQGIISHGANVPPAKRETDPFYVVHAGHGTIALGAIPRQPLSAAPVGPPTPTGFGTGNDGRSVNTQDSQWSPSVRYLLRTLTRCPVLCAVGFTPIELLQLQLEKLAVNSILNPLTAILDNRNGSILYNFALSRTMRLMLAETSLIIRSLPELRGIPNVPNRFSPERLETLVVSVANQTKDNISSMLADVRTGRQTEIEYINGYIVRRGEEMGIKAVVNYAMMQTVLGKCAMVVREMNNSIPVAGRGEGLNNDE